MAKEFVHNHVEPLELILHACLYASFLINDVIIWFSLIFWFCVVEITRSISVTEKIKDYCISLWTVCVLFFPFNSVVFSYHIFIHIASVTETPVEMFVLQGFMWSYLCCWEASRTAWVARNTCWKQIFVAEMITSVWFVEVLVEPHFVEVFDLKGCRDTCMVVLCLLSNVIRKHFTKVMKIILKHSNVQNKPKYSYWFLAFIK